MGNKQSAFPFVFGKGKYAIHELQDLQELSMVKSSPRHTQARASLQARVFFFEASKDIPTTNTNGE